MKPDARAAAWWEGFRARQIARAKGTCCAKHKAERAVRGGKECEREACPDVKGKAFGLLVLPGIRNDVRRLVVCRRCYGARKDHRFADFGGA